MATNAENNVYIECTLLTPAQLHILRIHKLHFPNYLPFQIEVYVYKSPISSEA